VTVIERYDLAALRRELAGMRLLDDATSLKRRSRDYHWFSPIATAALRGKLADLIALPRSLEEVRAVASACARHRVPLVPRGAGTGTYGQAVPLRGGVVLDLSELTGIVEMDGARFRARAGTTLWDVEAAARARGAELRMHPSTKRIATVGGYFCGGSGGIGSVAWGGLREHGNFAAATVITLEEAPQTIELRGDETGLVNRTFGATGIVVEVEAPLAPARPWRDVMLTFARIEDALAVAARLAADAAIAKRLVSLHDPVSAAFLAPVAHLIPQGHSAVLAMIDAGDMGRLDPGPGRIALDADALAREAAPGETPLYELSWGHTTLHAIRQDRRISYLQTLFQGDVVAKALAMHRRFGPELPLHLEFITYEGRPAANGAQLWPFTSEARLGEIVAIHEAAGIPVANPHVHTVEDGSRHKRVPGDQLAFKARTDPHGLLNPGKMPSYRAVRP
jgi:FAD/FMN-containing dehydrogenase